MRQVTGGHSLHFSPAPVGVDMHATWLGTRMSCDNRQACDWKNNCLTTVEILSFLPTNILFKRVQVDKISKTIVMNYFIRACRFISVKYLGKIPAPSKILHSLLRQNVPFVHVRAVVHHVTVAGDRCEKLDACTCQVWTCMRHVVRTPGRCSAGMWVIFPRLLP